MAHNHFHDLLGIAAIEFQLHLAAGFDGADAPIKLIGRPNRVPVELGDKIAGFEAKKINWAVIVDLLNLDSPDAGAGSAATAI